MEKRSFDGLTKEMANDTLSRGQLLKLLAAALLAALFASFSVPRTARAVGLCAFPTTACPSVNPLTCCLPDQVCSNNTCVSCGGINQPCCINPIVTPCFNGATCQNGTCSCPSGTTQCGTGTSATCCSYATHKHHKKHHHHP